MATELNPETILARSGLLDALQALGTHHESVVLVGAQAIYLRTGTAAVALAEFTTDADLAIAAIPQRVMILRPDVRASAGSVHAIYATARVSRRRFRRARRSSATGPRPARHPRSAGSPDGSAPVRRSTRPRSRSRPACPR